MSTLIVRDPYPYDDTSFDIYTLEISPNYLLKVYGNTTTTGVGIPWAIVGEVLPDYSIDYGTPVQIHTEWFYKGQFDGLIKIKDGFFFFYYGNSSFNTRAIVGEVVGKTINLGPLINITDDILGISPRNLKFVLRSSNTIEFELRVYAQSVWAPYNWITRSVIISFSTKAVTSTSIAFALTNLPEDETTFLYEAAYNSHLILLYYIYLTPHLILYDNSLNPTYLDSYMFPGFFGANQNIGRNTHLRDDCVVYRRSGVMKIKPYRITSDLFDVGATYTFAFTYQVSDLQKYKDFYCCASTSSQNNGDWIVLSTFIINNNVASAYNVIRNGVSSSVHTIDFGSNRYTSLAPVRDIVLTYRSFTNNQDESRVLSFLEVYDNISLQLDTSYSMVDSFISSDNLNLSLDVLSTGIELLPSDHLNLSLDTSYSIVDSFISSDNVNLSLDVLSTGMESLPSDNVNLLLDTSYSMVDSFISSDNLFIDYDLRIGELIDISTPSILLTSPITLDTHLTSAITLDTPLTSPITLDTHLISNIQDNINLTSRITLKKEL